MAMFYYNIPQNWKYHLDPALDIILTRLQRFIEQEIASGKIIYPPSGQVFQALQVIDFEKVNVVILGQDPYHGPGQAHGLSFSVPDGQRLPPSLRNIFKELTADTGIEAGSNGNLMKWAKQGVLLLNAVLTVESGRAGSHAGKGWEEITDNIIRVLSNKLDGVVFILWGNYANKKKELIDSKKHNIITSTHPSPLSASRGFFGSKPFSKTNYYLSQKGKPTIDWSTAHSR